MQERQLSAAATGDLGASKWCVKWLQYFFLYELNKGNLLCRIIPIKKERKKCSKIFFLPNKNHHNSQVELWYLTQLRNKITINLNIIHWINFMISFISLYIKYNCSFHLQHYSKAPVYIQNMFFWQVIHCKPTKPTKQKVYRLMI